MQPTISIPKHWAYPRFALDQRTKDGIILGLYYYPNGTELAEQFGHGWRYALMPNKNSDELFHFQEFQIQPLTPEELLHQIVIDHGICELKIFVLCLIIPLIWSESGCNSRMLTAQVYLILARLMN